MTTLVSTKGNSILFSLIIVQWVAIRGINVRSDDKGGSIITLGQGSNKARMVEYLNSTVKMLIKRQLDKNQFATNTISFIDSTPWNHS
jgi:hypothetical protein